MGTFITIPRSVVSFYPNLVSICCILDCGIVLRGPAPYAFSCDIDIPRRINSKGMGTFITIHRSIVSSYPKFDSISVILDCGIVKSCPAPGAISRNIDISRGINSDILAKVTTIHRSIVSSYPKLASISVILDCGIVIACPARLASSCHIDIPRRIHSDGIGIISSLISISSDPKLVSISVILDCGIVIGMPYIVAKACDIDVPRSINSECLAKVILIPRSVISSDPKLVSVRIILDCGIVIRCPAPVALPCDIDISRSINGESRGSVITIRRSVISSLPKLVSIWVILDCEIVIPCPTPGASSRDIDIPRSIYSDVTGIVITIPRSVVSGYPLLCNLGLRN